MELGSKDYQIELESNLIDTPWAHMDPEPIGYHICYACISTHTSGYMELSMDISMGISMAYANYRMVQDQHRYKDAPSGIKLSFVFWHCFEQLYC